PHRRRVAQSLLAGAAHARRGVAQQPPCLSDLGAPRPALVAARPLRLVDLGIGAGGARVGRGAHQPRARAAQDPSAAAEPAELAMISRRRLEELEAEARYHHELYEAKTYGPKPTSDARLRDLLRRHEGAESRLRRAREENAAPERPEEEP